MILDLDMWLKDFVDSLYLDILVSQSLDFVDVMDILGITNILGSTDIIHHTHYRWSRLRTL